MTSSVKTLGQYMLDNGCPENDCVIYKNTYKMYCEVKQDLTRCVVSDTSTMYLTRAEHQLLGQLTEMFYTNEAVRMFIQSIRKRARDND